MVMSGPGVLLYDPESIIWSTVGYRIHPYRISSVRVVDLVDDSCDLRNRELRLDVETAEGYGRVTVVQKMVKNALLSSTSIL